MYSSINCCAFKIKEDMRRTKVKVGIVGLGLNGRKHALAHANSRKSELVAVCDRDEVKLRAFGAELGVRKLFTSIDELLADTEIEAVSIHTPDGQHLEPFLKALEARKHILIEKPLANTEADVMTMFKAGREHGSGLKIQVGYILRFNPLFEAIYTLVRKEMLGQIYYMEADYVHNMTRKLKETDLASGRNWYLEDQIPMVSGGSHCIDLLRWIKGETPISVFSCGNHFAFPQFPRDDCMVSIFKFPDGSIAKVGALWAPECPRPPFYNLRIYGTKGTVENDRLCVGHLEPERNLCFEPIEAAKIEGHPYEPEVEDWLTAIIENTKVRTSLADGANSSMAALLAVRAALEGAEMRIPTL